MQWKGTSREQVREENADRTMGRVGCRVSVDQSCQSGPIYTPLLVRTDSARMGWRPVHAVLCRPTREGKTMKRTGKLSHPKALSFERASAPKRASRDKIPPNQSGRRLFVLHDLH